MSDLGQAPALGRRRLTAGLLAVPLLPVLAACDDDDVVDLPGLPPLGPDPDEPLLAAALDAERAILDTVRRTAARHRALRRVLVPAADVHAAHVALLEKSGGEADGGTGARGKVAANPGAALTALAVRERNLARQHVQRAVDARSGPFARLVAVLAAAATQQSVVLADAAAGLSRGGPS